MHQYSSLFIIICIIANLRYYQLKMKLRGIFSFATRFIYVGLKEIGTPLDVLVF